jgi:hypothetical protein
MFESHPDDQVVTRGVLRNVLEEIFEERAKIDSQVHADQHQWLTLKIEQEQDRKDMYKELTKAIIQWSVFGLLGGILYWFQTGHWPQS